MISVNTNIDNKIAFKGDTPKESFEKPVSQKTEDFEWLDIKPEKMSLKDESIGLFAGVACFFGVKKIVSKLQKFIINEKLMKNIDTISNNKAEPIINDMIEKANLYKKGFKLEFVTEKDNERILSKLVSDFEQSKLFSFYKKIKLDKPMKKLFEYQIKRMVDATTAGDNAFYTPISNMMVVNKNRKIIALHELGHAINFNKRPKLLKMFSLGLPLMILAELATYPVQKLLFNWSKKNYLWSKNLNIKAKEENDKKIANGEFSEQEVQTRKNIENFNKKTLKIANYSTKFSLKMEKIYDWIKNHAGSLVLVSFIPLLIEEASASLKGVASAKNKLNSTELLHLKKGLGAAFLTYIIATFVSSAGAKLGVYVRDKIVQNP
mgnify:CR=1 FL=1